MCTYIALYQITPGVPSAKSHVKSWQMEAFAFSCVFLQRGEKNLNRAGKAARKPCKEKSVFNELVLLFRTSQGCKLWQRRGGKSLARRIWDPLSE